MVAFVTDATIDRSSELKLSWSNVVEEASVLTSEVEDALCDDAESKFHKASVTVAIMTAGAVVDRSSGVKVAWSNVVEEASLIPFEVEDALCDDAESKFHEASVTVAIMTAGAAVDRSSGVKVAWSNVVEEASLIPFEVEDALCDDAESKFHEASVTVAIMTAGAAVDRSSGVKVAWSNVVEEASLIPFEVEDALCDDAESKFREASVTVAIMTAGAAVDRSSGVKVAWSNVVEEASLIPFEVEDALCDDAESKFREASVTVAIMTAGAAVDRSSGVKVAWSNVVEEASLIPFEVEDALCDDAESKFHEASVTVAIMTAGAAVDRSSGVKVAWSNVVEEASLIPFEVEDALCDGDESKFHVAGVPEVAIAV